MHGVIPPQKPDPALALVEYQTVLLCPSPPAVQILLEGYTALWGINHSSQFRITSKLAEEAFYPFMKVNNAL